MYESVCLSVSVYIKSSWLNSKLTLCFASVIHELAPASAPAHTHLHTQCRHEMDEIDLGTYAVKVCAVGDNRLWLRRVLGEVDIYIYLYPYLDVYLCFIYIDIYICEYI